MQQGNIQRSWRAMVLYKALMLMSCARCQSAKGLVVSDQIRWVLMVVIVARRLLEGWQVKGRVSKNNKKRSGRSTING
jgi:hypothetical protein